MTEDIISFSQLNDFVFCPVSIYFHALMTSLDKTLYQSTYQINGTKAHETIDTGTYSNRKTLLQGLEVYCESLGIGGKIDLFDETDGHLIERKKHITTIYDGYRFQLFGQCYALREMGYRVHRISLHSLDDNKSYAILLPEEDPLMNDRFLQVIQDIKVFEMASFIQNNKAKCEHCIYEPACDRG